jgi:hypothetical protein
VLAVWLTEVTLPNWSIVMVIAVVELPYVPEVTPEGFNPKSSVSVVAFARI